MTFVHPRQHQSSLRSVVFPTVTETYRYDGHGRRVLAWTALGNKLSMYASSGALVYQQLWPATMNKAVDYYYLSGSLVATRSVPLGGGAGTVAYQHTDALGSPVGVTDALGAVVERTDFDPYGNPINKIVGGVGYTGHVIDARTELVYTQQRYYDRSFGRFISTDPILASAATGQFFGRYHYAESNPLLLVDPDGRMAGVGPFFKHMFRNANQPDVPRSADEAREADWRQMSEFESEFHRRGPNGDENTKWIDPEGKMEAVYDGNGELVTDELNGGTFNYTSPDDWAGHFRDDVLPFLILGNGPHDVERHIRDQEDRERGEKDGPKEREAPEGPDKPNPEK